MSQHNFTTAIVVAQPPDEVFQAVNNVRGWWSEEIEGSTDQAGAVFKFHYRDFHLSTHRIIEMTPGKRIVWRTEDAQINFVKDRTEWNGTEVRFDIARKGDQTELRFTHVGLIPDIECYGRCSKAWSFYINESLFGLITAGQGKPNPKEIAETA